MAILGRTATEVRRIWTTLCEAEVPPAAALRDDRRLRRPVLLLHGFGSTPRMMAPLERALRRRGREVVRVAICPGRGDLRDSALRVMRVLDELARHPDFEHADLVGHSMGGLVATYVLKALDRGQRVHQVVTLGTPHRGCPAAWLGVLAVGRLSRAVWQMLPGSAFLRGLARRPTPHGSRITAIAGGEDWVVPGRFAGAHAAPVVIDGCSHMHLLVDRALHGLVGDVLSGSDHRVAVEGLKRAA